MKIRNLLILIFGLSLILSFCGKTGKQEQKVQNIKFQVRTQTVEEREIEKTLTYTGTVEAFKSENIIPKISGKIKKIYVEEGQRVVKGQILAELDDEQAKIQLSQAQGALQAARANFQNAKRNYLRAKRLLKEEAISRQQYEQMELAFKAAQGQLKQARAAVELAKFYIRSSKLKAPFSGIITNKLKQEGDFVNPGMAGFGTGPGILVLMDFSRVKVYVNIPSSEADLVKINSPAYLLWKGKTLEGKVFSVSQAADPASKTFKVGVMAENPELFLKPGTDVQVKIVYLRKKALAVPLAALVDENHVFVVENGIAHKRKVSLGVKGDFWVEVKQGLNAGERVVVGNLFGLYDGAMVEEEK